MKKVKAIRRYKDLELDVIKEKGEEFEVKDERAEHLVKRGMVEIIGDVEEPEETEKESEEPEETEEPQKTTKTTKK